MLIINDTPGVKVTSADVKPRRVEGTSDFDITTEATNPYSAYIIGDNYGSKFTGRYRTNVGLSANSPLGISHKVSLFADTGYATMEKSNGTFEARHLSDVGLGYQAFFQSFFAKAQVAHVIVLQLLHNLYFIMLS